MGVKKNYKDYPIKKKLLISHGIILVLSIVITIILLFGMVTIKGKVDGIYEKPMKNIEAIGDVRFGVTDVLRAMDRVMAENKKDLSESYKELEEDIARDIEIVMGATSILEKNLLTAEGVTMLNEITNAIAEGEKIRPQVMEAIKAGDMEEAYRLNFELFLPKVEGINQMADNLENQIRMTADDYYLSARNSSIVMIVIGVVLLIIGVMLAITITLRVTKVIVEPIQQITDAAERMNQGDMTAGEEITYVAEDEIGIVAESLRGAMKKLQEYIQEISGNLREIAQGDLTKHTDEITDFLGDFADIKESFVYILKRFNTTLTDIQESSDQVAASSKEIAESSQHLSEGATDQASAIEELTATIATVAEMAEESARNTQSAYSNIKVSADEAEQERIKMEELTEEMRRITEISKEIENIITAIEDIAAQTNLLSLNASIEAARAGEAGKGFAVVADQIGKLAADSAESAVNTRELIGKTLQEIEKGNAIAASTSIAFEKIIDDMKAFAELAHSTSETAKNQSVALEQIEQGIDQIAEVVQNTAASAEECSAISDDLSREAHDLDGQVKNFKLH